MANHAKWQHRDYDILVSKIGNSWLANIYPPKAQAPITSCEMPLTSNENALRFEAERTIDRLIDDTNAADE